jgi:hypothetical protein
MKGSVDPSCSNQAKGSTCAWFDMRLLGSKQRPLPGQERGRGGKCITFGQGQQAARVVARVALGVFKK